MRANGEEAKSLSWRSGRLRGTNVGRGAPNNNGELGRGLLKVESRSVMTQATSRACSLLYCIPMHRYKASEQPEHDDKVHDRFYSSPDSCWRPSDDEGAEEC